jgi:hypothetical protein
MIVSAQPNRFAIENIIDYLISEARFAGIIGLVLSRHN